MSGGFTHEGPGGSPEWYTPPSIFAALGLTFALDPCAPPLPRAAWIPAVWRYTLGEPETFTVPAAGGEYRVRDGLMATWKGRVWLNPPYGAETARWVGRLAEHGDGIALVFTRTDTPWWQAAVARADAVCFIAGRVEFIPGDLSFRRRSRSSASSCLIAFGEECAAAVRASGLGVCSGLTAVDRLRLTG